MKKVKNYFRMVMKMATRRWLNQSTLQLKLLIN